MFFYFVKKQISINLGTHGHKCLSKTWWEGWCWLFDSLLSSCNFRCVSRIKVVNCLFWCQLTDRRKHTECITCQKHDIFWMASDGRNLGIINKFQRIRGSSILCDRCVKIVNLMSLRVKNNILKNSSEFYSVVNLRLFFGAEVYTFCVTSSLNIENSLISPHMFIITNQFSISDCT